MSKSRSPYGFSGLSNQRYMLFDGCNIVRDAGNEDQLPYMLDRLREYEHTSNY